MASNVAMLRQLVREVRKAAVNKSKDNITIRYIMEQARVHQETSEILCKAKEEIEYLGKNYLCYLSSLRQYQEIYDVYNGKGERSIRETANLVGFKLPHDPKD